MSQRSEKLHRQVAQLRADVDALQVAWLSQQHCDAVELAAAAERTRQAHRRASEAQRTARAWKLNAILTLILAALIAGVALVISAKATTTEPATPSAVISPLDNGRLPGDDTPAMGVAADYAGREPVDTTALSQELDTAEEMRKHLNEYQRMVAMQAELEDLTEQSSEFTRKIELARELPAKILETAKIPVEGLTVENGVPLIRGLPISNLSDGELLELCVDISVSKPGQLQIILVDGAERLDKESRERLYTKCKEKGLQLIATRVTDSDALEVTVL